MPDEQRKTIEDQMAILKEKLTTNGLTMQYHVPGAHLQDHEVVKSTLEDTQDEGLDCRVKEVLRIGCAFDERFGCSDIDEVAVVWRYSPEGHRADECGNCKKDSMNDDHGIIGIVLETIRNISGKKGEGADKSRKALEQGGR